MYTEKEVLDHCLHNSDEVLRTVFFPMFKDELITRSGVKINGYHTALQHQSDITYEEWKRLRYKELRHEAYGSIDKQLEMQVDGTWIDHINEVKARYPKP